MKRKTKKRIILSILLIFLLYSVVSFFYVVLGSSLYTNQAKYFFYFAGRITGLMGFLFLSMLVISGEVARFLDRFFGFDRIIKFQRRFSLVTAVFVTLHPIFFILAGVLPSYLVPSLIAPFVIGIISFFIFIIVMVASVFYKRISYKGWQYIHILIYILFLLSLYHSIKIRPAQSPVPIKIVYTILFLAIVIGAIYRTNYKLKQKKLKFFVDKIKWETPDVFTLKLKTDNMIEYVPGQFCFLRLNRDKLYARHPFTISSSPQDKTLDFTIKIKGKFTRIASRLREGEEIIVEGPFGIFTQEDADKKSVFIAGGVGITPFISMIRNQIKKGEKQPVTLLYGVRTKKDIIFKKEFDSIKEKWFKRIYILSAETLTDKRYEYGYITEEIIKKYIKDIKNSVFYICGPEPMKDKVVKMLKNLGVKKRDIKIEDFFW
jgi:predicted ferric reductase